MSDRLDVDLVRIERDWSLDDIVTANQVLDAYEAAEAEARRKRARKPRYED